LSAGSHSAAVITMHSGGLVGQAHAGGPAAGPGRTSRAPRADRHRSGPPGVEQWCPIPRRSPRAARL